MNQKKSQLISFILTFLFGPLGVFYSSAGAALVLILLGLVTAFVAPPLVFIFWIISIFTGMHYTSKHNQMAKAAEEERQALLKAVAEKAS